MSVLPYVSDSEEDWFSALSSIMSLRTMFALRSLSRPALLRYTAAAQFHATSNCSGANVAVVSNFYVIYAGATHDRH